MTRLSGTAGVNAATGILTGLLSFAASLEPETDGSAQSHRQITLVHSDPHKGRRDLQNLNELKARRGGSIGTSLRRCACKRIG